MKFNQEMKRIYEGGTIGKALYAEGEYNHPIDPNIGSQIKELRPYEKHWRNFLPRTYYITHSLGPLMYITGAYPTRVTAFPVYSSEYPDTLMGLDVGDRAAIITCLNDDGSVYRVTGCAAFGGHENSYRICGLKGQVENLRDGSGRILLSYNEWETPEGIPSRMCYEPIWNDKDKALIATAGHGGGDFLVIRDFFDCIKGEKKPFFDVYAATTMASVAILSHRSLLERGAPYDIPDFRREEDRERYENDTLTPFYGSDGSEPTLPCCSNPAHEVKPEWREDYRRILNTEY
jgi:predicted dehydrogenase